MNKIKQGFTLIEILIVISIIGVLAVTLVPNIAGAPAKARDLSKKQAVMQADAAIQAYMVTTGKAPALAGCLDEEIDATLMKVIFDNKMPSATTAATNLAPECIKDGVIYPKFVKVVNDYRVMIKVESPASANASAAADTATYATGTTHFSSGEKT
ncbi:prepilin-type N-terminal cleavage/methylation domain-containing protein [bacterium]|nr:prepilin-type N-terminal cleavage/methylation domain-containing protein [bacterium]